MLLPGLACQASNRCESGGRTATSTRLVPRAIQIFDYGLFYETRRSDARTGSVRTPRFANFGLGTAHMSVSRDVQVCSSKSYPQICKLAKTVPGRFLFRARARGALPVRIAAVRAESD
jgi:hypothetical protein